MNMHVLFDIDDTLTKYGSHAMDRLFAGNFLFPVIADLAEAHGMERAEAERRIHAELDVNRFWDYPDFSRALGLSWEETLPSLRRWHSENLHALPDSVRLVRRLRKLGIPVSVISNNPRQGCLLKLEICGLADPGKNSSVFRNIFSTDLMKGCKGDEGSWDRAVSVLRSQGDETPVMIGDNFLEDGVLALRAGVAHSFILNRRNRTDFESIPCIRIVADADAVNLYELPGSFITAS